MRQLSALLLALCLVACGGDSPTGGGAAPKASVATVSVSPATLSLVQDESAPLVATALDAKGSIVLGDSARWSSSAPQVASVTAAGVVTGVASGTATVTAMTQGRTGSAVITVSPPPVASIALSADSLKVVPGQAAQLTVVLRDRNAKVLTGRTVTWRSEAPAIASVSGSGLVTGLASGSTVVTATSEGRSATVQVNVGGGGYIATAGGVATSGDSAVRIVVPSGALPGATAITITPLTALATAPPGATAVRGSVYALGPDGLKFSSPATVIIRYDPRQLPRWVVPGDLALMRWDGSQWSRLTNLVVDTAAKTIRGRTPGFSTVGVYFLNPVVTLTPAPGRVNAQQRSVSLRADVSGEGRLPDAFQYTWTNTASNGNLTHASGNTVQYTAVTPILPAGDIDGVSVSVRGQFVPDGPFEDLGTAQTTIKSDLSLSLQILPVRSLLQYGQAVNVDVQVRDITGNQPYSGSPYLRYYWTASSSAGDFNLPTGRITLGKGTYSAYPTSRQSSVSPKGDKISVQVKLVTFSLIPTAVIGKFRLDSTDTDIGVADAFVQVIPQYQVQLTPPSAQLQAGQSVALTVVLQPAWAETEQLFFQYRNTASQGTMSVAQGAPVTQSSVTYTAAAKPTGGTDFVDVDVFAGTIGKVGTARAAISVEALSNTVQGTFQVSQPTALDPGRQCVAAYIAFPLVPGAVSYDMQATGFNDTFFWKTSISRTFTTPFPTHRPCSLQGDFTTGVAGNEFRFFLSSFAGPTSSIGGAVASFNSRFAGMQVKVVAR